MKLNGENRACICIITLLCCLLWTGVSISEAPRKHPLDRENNLVFGYLPQVFYNVDPRDATELMEVWARMAESKSKDGVKTTAIVYRTNEDAEKDLANNKVDVLVMIPEEFVRLRAKYSLVPILSADYGRHFYNELLLLVREGDGITKIGQLRGKSLKIDQGQQGTIPIKWLDSLLETKFSSSSGRFFGSINPCTKSSQVIMPVFFNQVDAGLVSRSHFETMVELNPQIGRKLRILEQSPGFITGILAIRKDIEISRRESIVNALIGMHNDPKGKQIMTLFRINRLVPFMQEHLASVEKVMKGRRVSSENTAQRNQ